MDASQRFRRGGRSSTPSRVRRRGPTTLPLVVLVVLAIVASWLLARQLLAAFPVVVAPDRALVDTAASRNRAPSEPGGPVTSAAVPADASRGDLAAGADSRHVPAGGGSRPSPADPVPDPVRDPVAAIDARLDALDTPAAPEGLSAARLDPAPATTSDGNGSTPSPVPTGTAPAPRAAPITIAFTGDILPHGRVNDRAGGHAGDGGYDFAPLFAAVRPILSGADLALCHLEVPIAPPGEGITTYPSFGAPAALVDGIAAAGYDGCSLASNHSLDRGVRGVTTTLDEFDRVGLGHAGTARSSSEGGSITRYDVDGTRVAHLSYAYGFNGYRPPSDAPWLVNAIDAERITREARRAAEAAEIVVVSLHWGSEYVHTPSAEQRRLVAKLLPSEDIDLVVGHHAHVVQPIEQVDGTWVVFGLGNHLSNMVVDDQRDGLLALVRFRPAADGDWDVARIRAVPTFVDLDTHRVLPATRSGAEAASAALRDQLAASHDRTRAVLDAGRVDGLRSAPRP